MNFVPVPYSLSTVIGRRVRRPFFFTYADQGRKPLTSWRLPVDTRKNFSKIFFKSSRRMPMPLSSTVISMRSLSRSRLPGELQGGAPPSGI